MTQRNRSWSPLSLSGYAQHRLTSALHQVNLTPWSFFCTTVLAPQGLTRTPVWVPFCSARGDNFAVCPAGFLRSHQRPRPSFYPLFYLSEFHPVYRAL